MEFWVKNKIIEFFLVTILIILFFFYTLKSPSNLRWHMLKFRNNKIKKGSENDEYSKKQPLVFSGEKKTLA